MEKKNNKKIKIKIKKERKAINISSSSNQFIRPTIFLKKLESAKSKRKKKYEKYFGTPMKELKDFYEQYYEEPEK